MVILCGGESLRFRNAKHYTHKAMAPVGPKPILIHIIDRFRMFGLHRFIICVRDSDTEISEFFRKNPEPSAKIEVVTTGEDVPTGGRIKKIEDRIDRQHFFMSYGDCLNDIDLMDFWNRHDQSSAVATVAAANPNSAYGIMEFDVDGRVHTFREKPKLAHWVNSGLFLFKKEVFRFLNEETVLETDGLSQLINQENLYAYRHSGFWQAMDTPKEHKMLNEIWNAGNAAWTR